MTAKQVLVREAQVHGSVKVLKRAEVLATLYGGRLRVQVEGARKPIEVNAKDTLPIGLVAPGQALAMQQRLSALPTKSYPVSMSALCYR